jgi:hypothetical protein
LSTREMELGSLQPARGHVCVEQEAAGRLRILTLYGTRAGERTGRSRWLKEVTHPCDRIGRPLSPLEMELAAFDPARGHGCVERTGKHRLDILELDDVRKRDLHFSIPGWQE